MQGSAQGLAFIGFAVLGLFQFAAVMAGLQAWTSLPWVIAVLLALFIAYIPLVGTIVGMYGAVAAWHWSWILSAGLFFGPLAVFVMLAFGAGILGKSSNR